MVNEKTDLVQYYRLVGETEEYKKESDRRLIEDSDNNLITVDIVRERKLKELFGFE
jgi:hypothetical protein